MGTPQYRWRLMHQSGRSSTIDPMRLEAQAGIQRTLSSICSSALSRKPVLSMETNHCVVARKITGFLQRQQ